MERFPGGTTVSIPNARNISRRSTFLVVCYFYRKLALDPIVSRPSWVRSGIDGAAIDASSTEKTSSEGGIVPTFVHQDYLGDTAHWLGAALRLFAVCSALRGEESLDI